MAYTDIGPTDTKNYIIDGDEVDGYRWYLQGAQIKRIDPDTPLSFNRFETGITQCVRGFSLGHMFNITWMCDDSTHFQNFIKAKGTWKKEAKSLTLHYESAAWSGVNLASYADYATPTTLSDATGFIQNVRFDRQAKGTLIRCQFVLSTDMVSSL